MINKLLEIFEYVFIGVIVLCFLALVVGMVVLPIVGQLQGVEKLQPGWITSAIYGVIGQ